MLFSNRIKYLPEPAAGRPGLPRLRDRPPRPRPFCCLDRFCWLFRTELLLFCCLPVRPRDADRLRGFVCATLNL